MDGFLGKGACPCKTLQRDHCGREERPSAYPKELRRAVEGWQIPNSPETRFEIASVSKQFTTAAILQLADNGKLNVDDPISKYYTEAPASWKSVTVHQLLTHTSGLPNNDLVNFTKGICSPYAPDELIKSKRQSHKHKLDERGILLTTDAERPRQLG
jgi:CubicO group peptidase (beta-lactamase class C family)